ncbi:MAG: ABC transporter permease, partial [Candidatus Binatia bacterium]
MIVLLAPVLLLVGFLALPLVAIFLKVLPQEGIWETLQQPLVTEALRLSVITSLSSLFLAVVLGTPVAYLLARRRFRGAALLDTLIDLPMV